MSKFTLNSTITGQHRGTAFVGNTMPFYVDVLDDLYPIGDTKHLFGIRKDSPRGAATLALLGFFCAACERAQKADPTRKVPLYRIYIEQLLTAPVNGSVIGKRVWFCVVFEDVDVPSVFMAQILANARTLKEYGMEQQFTFLPASMHLMIRDVRSLVLTSCVNDMSTYMETAYETFTRASQLNIDANGRMNGNDGNANGWINVDAPAANNMFGGNNDDGAAAAPAEIVESLSMQAHPANPYNMFAMENAFAKSALGNHGVCQEQCSIGSYYGEREAGDVRWGLSFPFPRHIVEVDSHFIELTRFSLISDPFQVIMQKSSAHNIRSSDFYALISKPFGITADTILHEETVGADDDADPADQERDYNDIDAVSALTDKMYGIRCGSVKMSGLPQAKEVPKVDIMDILEERQVTRQLARENEERLKFLENTFKYDPEKAHLYQEEYAKYQCDAITKFMNAAMDPNNPVRSCERSVLGYYSKLSANETREEEEEARLLDAGLLDMIDLRTKQTPFMLRHARRDGRVSVSHFFNQEVVRTMRANHTFKLCHAHKLHDFITHAVASRYNHQMRLLFGILVEGDAMTSKSYLFNITEVCVVPGTAIQESGSSARADTAGNDTDGQLIICHELPLRKIYGSDGEKTGSSEFKTMMTEGRIMYKRLILAKDGGARPAATKNKMHAKAAEHMATNASDEKKSETHTEIIPTSCIASWLVASNEVPTNLLPIKSRFASIMVTKPNHGDRVTGVFQASDIGVLSSTIKQGTDPEFVALRDEYRLHDMYAYFVHTFIFMRIMKPVNLDMYEMVDRIFHKKLKEYGRSAGSTRDSERLMMLVTNLVIRTAVEKCFFSELSVLRNIMIQDGRNGKLGPFRPQYITLLEPFLYADHEISIYALTLSSHTYANTMYERVMRFIAYEFGNGFASYTDIYGKIDVGALTEKQRSYYARKSSVPEPIPPPVTASQAQQEEYARAKEDWRSNMHVDLDYLNLDASPDRMVEYACLHMPSPCPSPAEAKAILTQAMKMQIDTFYRDFDGNVVFEALGSTVDLDGEEHKVYSTEPLRKRQCAMIKVRVHKSTAPAKLSDSAYDQRSMDMQQEQEPGPVAASTAMVVHGKTSTAGGSFAYSAGGTLANIHNAGARGGDDESVYMYCVNIPSLQTPDEKIVYEAIMATGNNGMRPRIVLRGEKDEGILSLNQVVFFPTNSSLYTDCVRTVNTNFRSHAEALLLSASGTAKEFLEKYTSSHNKPGQVTTLDMYETYVYTGHLMNIYGPCIDNKPHINLGYGQAFEDAWHIYSTENPSEIPYIEYPSDVIKQRDIAEHAYKSVNSKTSFMQARKWNMQMPQLLSSQLFNSVAAQCIKRKRGDDDDGSAAMSLCALNSADRTEMEEEVGSYMQNIQNKIFGVSSREDMEELHNQIVAGKNMRRLEQDEAGAKTALEMQIEQCIKIGLTRAEAKRLVAEMDSSAGADYDTAQEYKQVNYRVVQRSRTETNGDSTKIITYKDVEELADGEAFDKNDENIVSRTMLVLDTTKRRGINLQRDRAHMAKKTQKLLEIAPRNAPMSAKSTGSVQDYFEKGCLQNAMLSPVSDTRSTASDPYSAKQSYSSSSVYVPDDDLTNHSFKSLASSTSSKNGTADDAVDMMHKPKFIPPGKHMRNVRKQMGAEASDSDVSTGPEPAAARGVLGVVSVRADVTTRRANATANGNTGTFASSRSASHF